MELELTHCPDCGNVAEVIDRFVLPSTHGAVEHAKVRCVTGHWFVVVADRLYAEPAAEPDFAHGRRRLQ